MPEYQLLETVSRNTLLGIRFWDPALDEQIRSGLHATLHPINNPQKKISATQTRSGVYAFNEIPGMFNLETQTDIEDIDSSSPVQTKQFVLEVNDPKQRYAGAALLVELPLPYKGIFLVDDIPASPDTAPSGFNLYSSVNRNNATQFTFVRGELIQRDTLQPAANAVVRVETEEGNSWFGISDAKGRFAVMMPYPYINIAFGSSPSTSDSTRLFQRTWTVSINILYESPAQTVLNGTDLPDYSSVLNQEQAFIYTESPETDLGEVLEMPADIVYGRDLIIKTEGFSELYISQTGSPM